MKTILLLLFLSITSFVTYSQNWSQIIDYSGSARDDGTSFKIGNDVYCGTGRNAGFAVTSDFKVFNLISETWTAISSMPDSCKRQYATSFEYNGIGYVFGGINASGDYLSGLWRYAPGIGLWTFVSNLPSNGRSGMSSFVLGSKAYIIGGKTDLSIATNEVWEFDLISLQWTQKNDLPNDGMWRGVSFTYDTTAFVGLGKNENDLVNSSFYHYLPTADQWQIVPGLNTNPRYYVGHAQIGDSVYLYGGVDEQGDYSNSFERINLPSLTIDVLNSFPGDARKGVMAFASNDDFFITTGISTTARLDETWVARNVVSLEEKGAVEVKVYQVGTEIMVSSNSEWSKLELLSTDGRIVKSYNMSNGSLINVSDVERGIYIYRLSGVEDYSGRILLNYEL